MIYYIGNPFNKDTINGLDGKPRKIINADLTKLDKYLDSRVGKYIILDTETTGLDPLKDKVIMLQIGTATNQFIVDTRKIELTESIKKKICSRNIKKIGVNIKFDYNMLKQFGMVLENVECLHINDKILHSGVYIDYVKFKNQYKATPYSLEGLAIRYLSKVASKEERMLFTTIGAMPYGEAHIAYGAQDVELPDLIYQKQYHSLKAKGYRTKRTFKNKDEVVFYGDICEFEGEASLAFGDMEYNGMPLNPIKWTDVIELFKKKKAEAIHTLNKLVTEHRLSPLKGVTGDMFDTQYTGINWQAPKQKLAVLHNAEIYPKDKKGKDTTSSKILKMHVDKNPKLIYSLMDFSKAAKQLSTYGVSMLEILDKHNRIHTSFNSIVATGRSSSRNPNLQNIPSLDIVRAAFEAKRGRKLVVGDYSQQEPRITADKCGDETLVDFFLNGDGDSHSLVGNRIATAITGKDLKISSDNVGWSEEFGRTWRAIGKTMNLGMDYGKTWESIMFDLRITKEQAQMLHNLALNAFPGKLKYFDRIIEESITNGYILINEELQRKREFPNFDVYRGIEKKILSGYGSNSDYNKLAQMRAKYSRLVMNTPTQGTAGDMTKLAQILIRRKLIADGIEPLQGADVLLCSTVHDEIIIDCIDSKADYVSNVLKDNMEIAGRVFCKVIPMIVKPNIGQHWTH